MFRNILLTAGCALVLLLAIGSTQAGAQRVHFRSNGGTWSHTGRAGYHRYWGGPSIGFYYAPSPVYIVAGYSNPSYYTGTSFWYSNPSFGLNTNVGGNGHHSTMHSNGGGHISSQTTAKRANNQKPGRSVGGASAGQAVGGRSAAAQREGSNSAQGGGNPR
jgi:hypothetical protein